MRNKRFNTFLFLVAVSHCCIMAFVFGELGGVLNLLSAGCGFACYSMIAARPYLKEKNRKLICSSDLTK